MGTTDVTSNVETTEKPVQGTAPIPIRTERSQREIVSQAADSLVAAYGGGAITIAADNQRIQFAWRGLSPQQVEHMLCLAITQNVTQLMAAREAQIKQAAESK